MGSDARRRSEGWCVRCTLSCASGAYRTAVTDRLAYMNFVQGSLAGTLAVKLNDSRAALKELRDAENNLAPRRNIRAGFETQITRIEHQQEKGMESKLAQLREQLHKAQGEDEALENEIEVLKRKGVRESEKEKWDALREVR